MKDKNLKIEFNERALFNMMHSVRIAIDKPVIQFHYQIEDIEKNSHSLYPVGREGREGRSTNFPF